jgi:hypothetical protein
MVGGFVAHAGVLGNLLLAAVCFAVLWLGLWMVRYPSAFWDQFNPYLKPYSRSVIFLGRVIGSLWAAGAVSGCILLFGNAIRAGLNRHWM